jgi:Condensation domain
VHQSSKPAPDERMVRARAATEPRVLSIGQERLWYVHQIAPDSPAYNLAYWCALSGPLNVSALQAALNAVVRRHQVLRTVILAPGGKPVPILLKKWAVELKQINLTAAGSPALEAVLAEQSARPFNLAREVLLRAALVQISDQEFVFLHNAPHLAFEGGSVEVLYRELAFYYDAYLRGSTEELPEPCLQFSDFAHWQREFLSGTRLQTLIAHWEERLAASPTLQLPLDFPRPAVFSARGRHYFFSLSSDLLRQADDFFTTAATTRYRGLCAAFCVFLHAYTGQQDILLGSPFSPRCSGIEELIGFFVNTVALRTNLSGNPTFLDVIRRVNKTVRDAIENSDLTFDKMVEAARVTRDASRTPLFQANFRAPRRPYPTLQLKGLHGSRARYADNGTSKFDLSLEIDALGEDCFFEYCSDLFRPETVERMVTDFKVLLQELIERPGLPVSSLKSFLEIRNKTTRA